MTNAMRSGYRKTLGFLSGIFAGFLIVMLLCGLLNVAVQGVLPQARTWLNVAGAVYLVYLAVHVALSKPVEEEPEGQNTNTFAAGLALQFLNAKVILYGVTVYSLFITQAFSGALAAGLFAPLLAGVGFLATSTWALGGDLFRRPLRRYYRPFNLLMAALLVYTAAASLWH